MVKKKKKVDEWTHIRVRVSIKKFLEKLKVEKRESINNVLFRIVKEIKYQKLFEIEWKKQTKKNKKS